MNGINAPANNSSSTAANAVNSAGNLPRYQRICWICYNNEAEDRDNSWVRPCKCRGATQWVHRRCMHRWIGVQQRIYPRREVKCALCETVYNIQMGEMSKVSRILQHIDQLITRASPYIAAAFICGAVYWFGTTFGAVTYLQIVGVEEGLATMERRGVLFILTVLPAIPVVIFLGNLIPTDDIVIHLLRLRRNNVANAENSQLPIAPVIWDPLSPSRTLLNTIMLPTISLFVGRLLFETRIENSVLRTLAGGLCFVGVKLFFRVYYKLQKHKRQMNRSVLDYNAENNENNE